jgi:hypothetical protein
MANNYTQFSECFDNLTDEQAKYAEILLSTLDAFLSYEGEVDGDCPEDIKEALSELDTDSFENFGFFNWSIEDDEGNPGNKKIWFYSEDHGNPDAVADVVRHLLKKFNRTGEAWTLSYSSSCSQPRVGEFGGGTLIVTSHVILDNTIPIQDIIDDTTTDRRKECIDTIKHNTTNEQALEIAIKLAKHVPLSALEEIIAP